MHSFLKFFLKIYFIGNILFPSAIYARSSLPIYSLDSYFRANLREIKSATIVQSYLVGLVDDLGQSKIRLYDLRRKKRISL